MSVEVSPIAVGFAAVIRPASTEPECCAAAARRPGSWASSKLDCPGPQGPWLLILLTTTADLRSAAKERALQPTFSNRPAIDFGTRMIARFSARIFDPNPPNWIVWFRNGSLLSRLTKLPVPAPSN